MELDPAGMEMLHREPLELLPCEPWLPESDFSSCRSMGLACGGMAAVMAALSLASWPMTGRWVNPFAWWFQGVTSMRDVWFMATLLWPLGDACETVRPPPPPLGERSSGARSGG